MGRLDEWISHVGNNRTGYGLGILLIVAHLIIAAERVYRFRHAGPWVVIARIGGQCLNFDSAVVITLTLRRFMLWLRALGLDWLLPLDRHVHFHKLIGWWICVFSVLHTAGHFVNYAVTSYRTATPFYDVLFNPTAGWIPGFVVPTGFALFGIMFIMGLFSHRYVRRSGRFELFYWTHTLCLPYFLLVILHAPNTWKWVIGPLCLFAIELFYRIWFVCSNRGRAQVSTVILLPNKVVRLKIERPPHFNYESGDYMFVNIPQVATSEWHPFTISSAPEDEDFLTIHVRVAGGWTAKLHSVCQAEAARVLGRKTIMAPTSEINPFQPDNKAPPSGQDNKAFESEYSTLPPGTEVAVTVRKPDTNEFSPVEMPILLDGPYGGSSARAWKCRHALLIAGGIGVTPFASLLQSIMSRYQSAMSPCPHCFNSTVTKLPTTMGKLRHVDFLWVNRDLLSFQWFLELLLNLDREQSVMGSALKKFLDIRLYQTGDTTFCDSYKPCKTCLETLPKMTTSDRGTLKPRADRHTKVVNTMVETEATPEDGKCAYCTLRQMKHLLHYSRPVWDELFREVAVRSGGRVAVFYCGPPAMGRIVRAECRRFGFTFAKEF